MKEFVCLVLALVVVDYVVERSLVFRAAQPERKPAMSFLDADREVHPLMNHGLILTLERGDDDSGFADLTIAADMLSITVQRLAPDELRSLAGALNHYADRLEGR